MQQKHTNTTKKVHDRYENQSKEETEKRDNMAGTMQNSPWKYKTKVGWIQKNNYIMSKNGLQ